MQLDLFSQPQPNPNRLINQQQVQQIDGLRLLEDYVDNIYEQVLIAQIDKSRWSNELKRRVQHYGYQYNYKTRRITSDAYLGPLPDWLRDLSFRLLADKLITIEPDQAIINEYEPGQGIAPHIDCQPCFGETIISLSLGASCVMVFSRQMNDRQIVVQLEPRSLLLMQGEARHHWLHSIPARKFDTWPETTERKRRISITFRKTVSQ